MFSCGSILIEVINFNNAFSRSLILAPHEFACKPNLSLHNLTAISKWALPYWKVTKYNHQKEPNECHLKQSHIEQKCSKIDKYHFNRNHHEKKSLLPIHYCIQFLWAQYFLAPKVLLENCWPIMTIHPIWSNQFFGLRCLERHKMTLEELRRVRKIERRNFNKIDNRNDNHKNHFYQTK